MAAAAEVVMGDVSNRGRHHLSRLAPELHTTDKRLEDWGRMVRSDSARAEVGWPFVSVAYRLAQRREVAITKATRVTHMLIDTGDGIKCHRCGLSEKDSRRKACLRSVTARITSEVQSVRKPTHIESDVERTDHAIARLLEIEQAVIAACYAYASGLPIPQQARSCHMNEQRYNRVLNRARWRIHDYLAGVECHN